jgi:hypothetical protein
MDAVGRRIRTGALLLAGCLASAATATEPAAQLPGAASTAAQRATVVPNTVTSGREALMLRRRWGIDDVHVRATASGSVVRFSYRVVDAVKAKILNDKDAEPYMLVNKTGARLQVPTTEKVGQLRQVAPAENGREYWMVFANVARMAQPGDHVALVIGNFRAEELVVESAGPAHPVAKR